MRCRFDGCPAEAGDSGWCRDHDLQRIGRQDQVHIQWEPEIKREVDAIIKGKKVSDEEKFRLLEKKLWQLTQSRAPRVALEATTKLLGALKLRQELSLPEEALPQITEGSGPKLLELKKVD